MRQGGLEGLFVLLACSYVLFGVVNLAAFASGASWRKLAPRAA